MKVLLYVDGWQGDEVALAEVLSGEVSGVDWEICRHLVHLAKLVSQPGREWAAVVAAVGSPADLRVLEPFGDQLSRLGLLLILPNQDDTMVALGHRLAPRFLAGGSDAPSLIAQVLGQMVRSRDSRPCQGAG